MVNRDIIPNLKASTLALAIVDGKKVVPPLYVGGTGFLISDDGFFITATHVLETLSKELPNYKKDNDNATIMAVRYLPKSTTDISVLSAELLAVRNIKATLDSTFHSSVNIDVSVCRLRGVHHDLNFLKLKTPKEINVYDEILMCGYPKSTLTIKSDPLSSTRISPVLQTGRISTIFPHDNTEDPEGIQTDIIGTGGSSGSAIIDANDGEVIAIAQGVLAVSVYKDEIINDNSQLKWVRRDVGRGDTGLTFGVTMSLHFKRVLEGVESIKQKYYENNHLKPELSNPPERQQYKT